MFQHTMRIRAMGLICAILAAAGCDDDDQTDPVPQPEGIQVSPSTAQSVSPGATAAYTIGGLDDAQAYRITLVVEDNVAVTGAAGVFVDNNDDGAADAGASEQIALITTVNGEAMDGAKTVPGGMDDPANPSGVNPVNGEIVIEVQGVGAGAVHPVAYVNGGASTFLEINDAGTPIEPHAVGGKLTVNAPDTITVTPGTDRTVAVDESADYTISGLNDDQAYRVTLVVADNITLTGAGMGQFVDADMSATADAGPSQDVALITMINGGMVDGAKTVPGGMDDPMAPSGVFPENGQITLSVTGVGVGMVHPVAYENGGGSTFLEVDADGTPFEPYSIGGGLSVTDDGPTGISVDGGGTIDVGDSSEYVISGLTDGQAYRVTLVVADNVTAAEGQGTFIDNDMNGAADAGASQDVALITRIGDMDIDGAKTIPGGMDDPANPTGVFPTDGEIRLQITGVGAGTVHPVAYVNAGASTFLEIDDAGTPIEPHGVGEALTVNPPTGPSVAPATPTTARGGASTLYTITNLDDAQAYRITLVVADNLTLGAGGKALFVDGDMNGAADAGASQDVALITTVNGEMMMGAKTVPGGMDDPADPSGVFPMDGTITLEVTGVGGGTVHPVVYTNAGASTFLEIDMDGAPIEPYNVGGGLTIDGPAMAPAGPQTIAVDDSLDYTISGLTDGQAYRITLVVDANITVADDYSGMFIDGDENGAADAGPSQDVALITHVDGEALEMGAKTVPSPLDITSDPSGVFPTDGRIQLSIQGVGAGAVRAVAYTNAGESTFLEIDAAGAPIEPYGVSGLITVE